jgi:hypothetical protein
MDQHGADAEAQRYLTIYLQDHRAGAEAGLRLAERCRDHAPDEAAAAELSRLVTEIDDDRRALATIMAGLDVDPSTVKHIAGLASERLGRLKLNGRAVRTSPLSVLVELEGLIGAVSIKRELWATLRALAASGAGQHADLEALATRADDQRARLQRLHGRVVGEVFAGSQPATIPSGSGPDVSDTGSGHA